MEVAYKKMSSHGSISIPVAMRRAMGIEPKDPMEVTVNSRNEIVIKQYVLRCNFCGTTEDVKSFRGKGVCKICAREIKGGYHDRDRK